MHFRMRGKIMTTKGPTEARRGREIGSLEEAAQSNSMFLETSHQSLQLRLFCTWPMKVISDLGPLEQQENKFMLFEAIKLLVVHYSRDRALICSLKPALAGITGFISQGLGQLEPSMA